MLYIFRHGQTDWNAEGRIQGHLDVPLNDHGRAQARSIAPHLKRFGIEALLSSDLSRAHETAQIIANYIGGSAGSLPVFTDQGLREIHLGKVQGLTRDEIAVKFGEEFSRNLRSLPLTDAEVALTGSETGEQVIHRALSAIQRFFEATKDQGFKSIGIATHGGVVRRLIQRATQRTSNDGSFPPPIPNGIIYPLHLRLARPGEIPEIQMGSSLPLNSH
ncbi:histidine phosphatase family protein [Bdellovibrionota bacterium FG-2]